MDNDGYLSDILPTQNSQPSSQSSDELNHFDKILSPPYSQFLSTQYEQRLQKLSNILQETCQMILSDEVLFEMKHNSVSNVFIPSYLNEIINNQLDGDREKYIKHLMDKLATTEWKLLKQMENDRLARNKILKLESEVKKTREAEGVAQTFREKLAALEKNYNEYTSNTESEIYLLKYKADESKKQLENLQLMYEKAMGNVVELTKENEVLRKENEEKDYEFSILEQSYHQNSRELAIIENIDKQDETLKKEIRDKLELVTNQRNTLQNELQEVRNELKFTKYEYDQLQISMEGTLTNEKNMKDQLSLSLTQLENKTNQEIENHRIQMEELQNKLKNNKKKLNDELQREKRFAITLQEEFNGIKLKNEILQRENFHLKDMQNNLTNQLMNEQQKLSFANNQIQNLNEQISQLKVQLMEQEMNSKQLEEKLKEMEMLKDKETSLIEERVRYQVERDAERQRLLLEQKAAVYKLQYQNELGNIQNQLRHSYTFGSQYPNINQVSGPNNSQNPTLGIHNEISRGVIQSSIIDDHLQSEVTFQQTIDRWVTEREAMEEMHKKQVRSLESKLLSLRVEYETAMKTTQSKLMEASGNIETLKDMVQENRVVIDSQNVIITKAKETIRKLEEEIHQLKHIQMEATHQYDQLQSRFHELQQNYDYLREDVNLNPTVSENPTTATVEMLLPPRQYSHYEPNLSLSTSSHNNPNPHPHPHQLGSSALDASMSNKVNHSSSSSPTPALYLQENKDLQKKNHLLQTTIHQLTEQLTQALDDSRILKIRHENNEKIYKELENQMKSVEDRMKQYQNEVNNLKLQNKQLKEKLHQNENDVKEQLQLLEKSEVVICNWEKRCKELEEKYKLMELNVKRQDVEHQIEINKIKEQFDGNHQKLSSSSNEWQNKINSIKDDYQQKCSILETKNMELEIHLKIIQEQIENNNQEIIKKNQLIEQKSKEYMTKNLEYGKIVHELMEKTKKYDELKLLYDNLKSNMKDIIKGSQNDEQQKLLQEMNQYQINEKKKMELELKNENLSIFMNNEINYKQNQHQLDLLKNELKNMEKKVEYEKNLNEINKKELQDEKNVNINLKLNMKKLKQIIQKVSQNVLNDLARVRSEYENIRRHMILFKEQMSMEMEKSQLGLKGRLEKAFELLDVIHQKKLSDSRITLIHAHSSELNSLQSKFIEQIKELNKKHTIELTQMQNNLVEKAEKAYDKISKIGYDSIQTNSSDLFSFPTGGALSKGTKSVMNSTDLESSPSRYASTSKSSLHAYQSTLNGSMDALISCGIITTIQSQQIIAIAVRHEEPSFAALLGAKNLLSGFIEEYLTSRNIDYSSTDSSRHHLKYEASINDSYKFQIPVPFNSVINEKFPEYLKLQKAAAMADSSVSNNKDQKLH